MKRNNRKNNKPLSPCVTVTAEEHRGDIDRMIRRFRKMVKNEGIIEECRERQYFKAPSQKRREKKEERNILIRMGVIMTLKNTQLIRMDVFIKDFNRLFYNTYLRLHIFQY